MDLGLRNKQVLVSGGASGIGEAIVRGFVSEGARVAVVDRDEQRGRKLVAELKESSAFFVAADLCDSAACEQAVAAVLQTTGGRLDVLVNGAGVNDSVGLSQTPEQFAASLQNNLSHYFALAHFCRSALVASCGTIVNIGSKVAVSGQGSTSGYAAAKGAVNALTREWAVALAPHGVRVNAVCPAEVFTPMYQSWLQSRPDPLAARRAIEKLVPLGRRMTQPAEIADTVVFLASGRSGHTTGQILFVDGGYTFLDRACTAD